MSGRSALGGAVTGHRGWHWGRAAAAGLVAFAAVFVPSDLLDTTLFTRMTSPHWWDYLFATATVLLTATAGGLGRPGCGRGASVGATPITATGAVALAVGCPLCNKIVLAVIGTTGALEYWAPLQPVLGAVSVLLLAFVVCVRWHVAANACANDTSNPTAASGTTAPAPAEKNVAVR